MAKKTKRYPMSDNILAAMYHERNWHRYAAKAAAAVGDMAQYDSEIVAVNSIQPLIDTYIDDMHDLLETNPDILRNAARRYQEFAVSLFVGGHSIDYADREMDKANAAAEQIERMIADIAEEED